MLLRQVATTLDGMRAPTTPSEVLAENAQKGWVYSESTHLAAAFNVAAAQLLQRVCPITHAKEPLVFSEVEYSMPGGAGNPKASNLRCVASVGCKRPTREVG